MKEEVWYNSATDSMIAASDTMAYWEERRQLYGFVVYFTDKYFFMSLNGYEYICDL